MGRGEYLGELEAMVLAAVRRTAPGNGVAVHQEIAALTGRDPSLAAIHMTLRRLEAKRLLTSSVADASPRGGRPRRYYEPTPAGIDALDAFRDMWRSLWKGIDSNRPARRRT